MFGAGRSGRAACLACWLGAGEGGSQHAAGRRRLLCGMAFGPAAWRLLGGEAGGLVFPVWPAAAGGVNGGRLRGGGRAAALGRPPALAARALCGWAGRCMWARWLAGGDYQRGDTGDTASGPAQLAGGLNFCTDPPGAWDMQTLFKPFVSRRAALLLLGSARLPFISPRASLERIYFVLYMFWWQATTLHGACGGRFAPLQRQRPSCQQSWPAWGALAL